MTQPIINLKTGSTACPYGVESRAPGTYVRDFLIQGNCVKSSLFISSIDPGATITAVYTDTTTGQNLGESILLDTHGPFDDTATLPLTDQLSIGGFHNKPKLTITVTGGNVEFGVYTTGCESAGSVGPAGELLTKPQGLCTDARFREVTVTTAWTPLASTPFKRNSIAIQNRHAPGKKSNVKINWPPDISTLPAGVTGYVGMLLEYDEERQYDIKDNVTPYARVEKAADSPVILYVEEVE